MTDLPPLEAAANPSSWRRRTTGFLVICLLVFAPLAGWLHFFAPRSAPPGVTMTDLHGVADLQALTHRPSWCLRDQVRGKVVPAGRAIPSTTPPVRHGQPRTLTVL